MVFCFPGLPIYAENVPYSGSQKEPCHQRTREARFQMTGSRFRLKQVPDPMLSYQDAQKVLASYRYRAPCPCFEWSPMEWMLEPLNKLRDPRLVGTVSSLHTTAIANTAWGNKVAAWEGGPRKTGLGWPCGTTGERGAGQYFPMGRRLRLLTGVHPAKMYLSRYQYSAVTTSKKQTDQRFILMQQEELGSDRCSLSLYALHPQRGQKGRTPICPSIAWLEPAVL